jgi:hypothetical protein
VTILNLIVVKIDQLVGREVSPANFRIWPRHLRFVPKTRHSALRQNWRYSISSSARARSVGGTSMPRALAVLRAGFPRRSKHPGYSIT